MCPPRPRSALLRRIRHCLCRSEKTPFNTRHKVPCPSRRREPGHSEGDQKLEPRPLAAWQVLRRAYASDHQFVGDAAHIDFEIEALHRRTREMPGQTARDGSAASELVGKSGWMSKIV